LRISPIFRRAVVPVLLAGIATALGAYLAVHFGTQFVHTGFKQVVLLALAGVIATVAYVGVVLLFRKRLPLGRFAA
jgi:hypothetical protein